jgi:serine/threonine protein kinase
VKVVDFGSAQTPATMRLAKLGQALGSPNYMAPEACLGEDIDARADIYSFGVVLYLMLCGRLPFEDEDVQNVLWMQVHAPLPPPLEVYPELPPQLAELLERALQKERDSRYGSMEELLVDLEAALPPGPIDAIEGAGRGHLGVQDHAVSRTRAVSSQRFPTSRSRCPRRTRYPAAVGCCQS